MGRSYPGPSHTAHASSAYEAITKTTTAAGPSACLRVPWSAMRRHSPPGPTRGHRMPSPANRGRTPLSRVHAHVLCRGLTSLVSRPAPHSSSPSHCASPSYVSPSSAFLGCNGVLSSSAHPHGRSSGRDARLTCLGQRPASQRAGACTCTMAGVAGSSQVATAAAIFTLSTAAVIPLYTLMLFAPGRPLTRKVMRSSIPWVILGALYIYLLALSWTPLTLPSMFSSKYWLPELPSITRMFSSTLTVASAWIHLLSVDLYAARSVYFDGQHLGVETRHSLCLCLLFAPIGILCHALTRAVALAWRSSSMKIVDDKLEDVSWQ